MIRSERLTDRVRRVTIDRPTARNAVRPRELTALDNAIRDASERVVLLVGAGSAFCAGADLETVASLTDPAAFAAHGQRVTRRIADSDAVVIAGVNGPARGGGVELALACDLRIATERASFAESGVKLGLFGAWGGTRRLRRELPGAVARDLALSGRTIDAAEARRAGLVSRIADPVAVAREVAAAPADTLARIGRLCRDDAGRVLDSDRTTSEDRSTTDDRDHTTDETGRTPNDRRDRTASGTTDREASEAAEREAFAALHEAHADELADRR